MISFSDSYFYITTNKSSYIMQILPDGILKHCYYGKSIPEENMDYYNLYTDSGFDYTDSLQVLDKFTTMDALPQECSSNGRGDYRSPAVVIEGISGRAVNDFRYSSHNITKGVPHLEGLPQLNAKESEAETLEIVLEDIISKAVLHLYYSAFFDVDIIARHIRIENPTEETVFIKNVMSMCLDFERSDLEMISLYGRWANEHSIERYPLHHGKSVISSGRGATGHSNCPFVALVSKNTDEKTGEIYAVSLIYSGNFEIAAEVGQFGTIRLLAGINHEQFSWELKPGETFVSPQAILTYTFEGLGQMSKNFHEVCRRHLGAVSENRKHPIVLNLWEAFYFDVTEQKVIESIEASKDFGIDTLVLDDGWFGKRENEFTSLGDWHINYDKFPNGFDKIISLCNEKNLQFGLWFEPETISPKSELYKQHPDWCIHLDGISPVKSRNEYLLDFSRKEIVDYIYNSISDILGKYDIRYVKWDMNRNMTDFGSLALGAQNQGEHAHRYILGVYDLMERLRISFPDVFFEGSAGGGGRFDFGILYYMHQVWTSDNTDAIGRLSIQYGTSMLFPPETISCHISDCPNHQTNRITPFKTRADVAQLFSFGYELNPNKLKGDLKDLLISQVEKHRELEEWIYTASFNRLINPQENDCCAWQMVSQDKCHSVVVYVTQMTSPKKPGKFLRLTGLNNDKKYKVLPLNITVSGETLMNAGLPIKEQYIDYKSTLFDITQIMN